MDTLVIGDCHGHYDRLEALLKQEGIIGECPACGGSGDLTDRQREIFESFLETISCGLPEFCSVCQGDGVARINKDVEVIQLGDLGHFGSEHLMGRMVPGSPTGDLLCWKAAVEGCWVDRILWGNHDRAVVENERHAFSGYMQPPGKTIDLMQRAHKEGRLTLAHTAHGFLLTHAGLHAAFKHQKDVDPEVKIDPEAFVEWVNKDPSEPFAIRDAISIKRGGRAPSGGGILWRDATEKLYPDFRQVFGHTKGEKVRMYGNKSGWSYCVDIGDQNNGKLAAIWLPSEKIVKINTNLGTQSTPYEWT